MSYPDLAFSLGNGLALAAWIALAVSLWLRDGRRAIIWTATAVTLPTLLAVAYLLLLAEAMARGGGGGFGSLAELRQLFAGDAALAAGWLHYLAFDLFVGSWIAREGIDAGVARPLILPCLVLTFLAGPVGLLLFLLLRFAASRRLGVAVR